MFMGIWREKEDFFVSIQKFDDSILILHLFKVINGKSFLSFFF